MAETNRLIRMNQKVLQQVDGIIEAFGKSEVLAMPAADGGVDYLCHPRQMLVLEAYLERVRGLLQQIRIIPGPAMPVIADVFLLKLELPPVEEWKKLYGEQEPLVFALDHIDSQLGEGIATPNHYLTVCGVVSPCPATEPRVVEDGIEPHPGVCTRNSGAGVLIYIADTGLLKHAAADHYWMHGVEPVIDGDDGWDPDDRTEPGGYIRSYTGHGTFVAGVVRCMAPRADVLVSNVFKRGGSALESDFVVDLKEALRRGVDIFNLTVAAPSRKDIHLRAFERWLALVEQYKGVVIVVAAGNSGVRLPTWPAAFSQVVSVGALTADGRDRADFSNYGGWVDVYAPGRDLVNAYTTGTYEYRDEPYTGEKRKFYGMAKWSGTSFSTPIVTGLIAARMSRTGENGREAADALLRHAQSQAIPDVGAILLPCDRRVTESRVAHHETET